MKYKPGRVGWGDFIEIKFQKKNSFLFLKQFKIVCVRDASKVVLSHYPLIKGKKRKIKKNIFMKGKREK